MTSSLPALLVVSRYIPPDITIAEEAGPEAGVLLVDADRRNDAMDDFNHPRYRRARILQELSHRMKSDTLSSTSIQFLKPEQPASDLGEYRIVQSTGLLDFFQDAWQRWEALGAEGRQDPLATLTTSGEATATTRGRSPPLVPGNIPLPREPHQRPSKNVMGQVGYYCTDMCTPIFAELKEELEWDVAVMSLAMKSFSEAPTSVVYALTTHPGHHAAQDSFGGYCYLNHAAFAARKFQTMYGYSKVAVLDVDYHCGNGTASIFYEDPTVLVISIHCHPDYDYPFHSGFEDETGMGEDAQGTTLHLPLLPSTTWKEYGVALKKATQKIQEFGAQALVVSLGLDTHLGDPCAVRRAGFSLSGDDYSEMGKEIGATSTESIPILVIQEGGYRMDKVPSAAADFLYSCAASK